MSPHPPSLAGSLNKRQQNTKHKFRSCDRTSTWVTRHDKLVYLKDGCTPCFAFNGSPPALTLSAGTFISACCVEQPPTALRPANLLSAGILHKYKDLPDNICYGFSMFLEHVQLYSMFSPNNHFSLRRHHKFVTAKYAKEIALGRVLRGYTHEELQALVGHYCSAPLLVIQQEFGSKPCIIINHSYPCNHSKSA